MPYEISMNITPEDARALLRSLAEDDGIRERFQSNPREVLAEHGIEVDDNQMPETVILPDKQEVLLFLDVLEQTGFSDVASAFGFALMVFAYGAMPVLAEDRPTLHGAG
jgi:putative modified peptide